MIYTSNEVMIYKIERTSSWGYQEEAPCSGAYRGENDENNYPQWFIDINTHEDIKAIIKETGKSVVVGEGYIEIYDAYRE